MTDNCDYDLSRFIEAQEENFETALREINNGKKESHWIWYIFPQLRQLGRSDTALYYGIKDSSEARAYLDNPYLRNNLITITDALLRHKNSRVENIMGEIDAVKLRSCMTLFNHVSDNPIFSEVLNIFYDGKKDPLSMKILSNEMNID